MMGSFPSSARPGIPVLVFALLACAAPITVQEAFAHPVYVDSTPGAFESVPTPPAQVNVFFSEAIEIDYSSISVLGPDGTRVDMNDKHHVDGDTASIGVTMQTALPEGEYTVTTKVLSAIDGHLIQETFIFGVGTAPTTDGSAQGAPVLAPGYSASRFPGMVGQVMVVGTAFGALWLWKPISRVRWLENELSSARLSIDKTMMKIIIVGAGLVLASGAAMIIVQAISIEAPVQDAIATKFGNIWITRMLQSSILMGIALAVYRRISANKLSPSRAELYALLIIGLAVLVTSSLIAHAAATEQTAAIVLDFFHNAAASFWIGGVILLGFAVVPKIMSLRDIRVGSAALSLLIPRFSIAVVTLLGISVITGPILLAALESDLSLTLASIYGQLLAVKLALAGVMVGLGAYSQFVIERKAVSVAVGGSSQVVSSRLKRYDRVLKAEAGVGIALLLVVSLMANGSLPAGQFPSYYREPGEQQAFAQEVDTAFVRTDFLPEGRIRLAISPFALGQNSFEVSFLDEQGRNLTSIQSAKIRITQIERGIGPISIDLQERSEGIFTANASFSLTGTWTMEIEGVNLQGSNLITTLDLQVKPLVENLAFVINQYGIPDRSLPLFPVFDGARQSIWVGDSLPGSGRIWQLDISTGNYTAHPVAGANLITQAVLGPDGSLWFIDPISGNLGNYDPQNNASQTFKVPDQGVLSGIAQDMTGDLWIPVVQANTVVRFDVELESFTSYALPTRGSIPVGISADRSGSLWLAQATGSVARIDASTGNITEIRPELQRYALDEPTSVFPDPRGTGIFISEHGGHTVTHYSTLLSTFRKYPVVNEAGLPFGMAMDSYGNLWFAQHEIDRLGIIDPRTGASTEVKIPISGSFVQWLTSDDTGRIWFAAQRGGALGSVTISGKPAVGGPDGGEQPGAGNGDVIPQLGFSLPDAAGPAIAAGIVVSALAYTKSTIDLRRNTRELVRQKPG
jgi:copper transport protein